MKRRHLRRNRDEDPDTFSAWLAGHVRRMPALNLIGAILGLIGGLAAAGILVMTAGPHEGPVVYARYNDALVERDLDLAWALGCRSDRATITKAAFAKLYDEAVAPLGELGSWDRLRGGADWHGSKGSAKALPIVVTEAHHSCVRLGGNPLGTPF